MTLDIKSLLRPNVRELTPYVPHESDCPVKLDANESPYPLRVPAKVFTSVDTNRYPDPGGSRLKKQLAKDLRRSEKNILLGNGSDEIIFHLVGAFGGPVLYPVPTFTMYGVIAKSLGFKTVEVPLKENFDIDLDRTLTALRRKKPKLIFLSSPNNPTGNSFSPDKILSIIKEAQGIVIVDEAYQMFSLQKSFVPLTAKHKNLAVLRTLSKVGLAALRTGLLVAGPEIIDCANRLRLPFNLNSYSQAAAVSVLETPEVLSSAVEKILRERKKLFAALSSHKSVAAYPTEANFILFRTKNPKGTHKALIDRGVLVRYLDGLDALRVTIGTPAENRAFIKALRKILG